MGNTAEDENRTERIIDEVFHRDGRKISSEDVVDVDDDN